MIKNITFTAEIKGAKCLQSQADQFWVLAAGWCLK